MTHRRQTKRKGITLLLLVAILALLTTAAILPTAAEDIIPISETETTTQPLGSTSVGLHTMQSRETALPVSYGLRVLAAREELVFAGLLGNEISFTAEDICRAMNLSELNYVTIRSLPNPGEGTLFVGSVGAAEGQVISAGSLSLLSFAASDDTKPTEATMSVSVNGSDYAVTCRLYLLDRLNYTPTVALAPVISLRIETYKDLTTAGTMSAYDPEGDEITYEITRYASHGRISLTDCHTGAYVYTPDPGYVGQDSFDYVVRDRYGNYSTSATVSILVSARPASVTYADIDGEGNAAAILAVSEWGLMNGTRVGSETYFKPSASVSRLEFLVTAMEAAGITADTVATAATPELADMESIPEAMRTYVSYAMQKGYIGGKTVDGRLYFRPDEQISRAEAAVVLSNIIGYAVEDTVTAFADEQSMPVWSEQAFTSLRALGVLQCPDGNAHAEKIMTRGDTAEWLYRTVKLMGR